MSEPPGLLLGALRAVGHASFLPFGLRDRLIRAIQSPDDGRDRSFQVDLRGMRYAGHLASYIDWFVYFDGCYEPQVADVLARLAASLPAGRRTVWDVGANCGHHALLMAKGAEVVHAFEPWGPVRAQLERNAVLNPQAKIVVHPFGLADFNENRSFLAPMGQNKGIGTFSGGYPGKVGPGALSDPHHKALAGNLPVRRGDDVVAEGLAPPPSLIKIDVEGYEPLVLTGLANTLARHRPLVALEYPEAGRGLYPQAGPHGGSPLSLMPEAYLFYVIVERGGQGVLVPSTPDAMLSPEVVLVPEELKGRVS